MQFCVSRANMWVISKKRFNLNSLNVDYEGSAKSSGCTPAGPELPTDVRGHYLTNHSGNNVAECDGCPWRTLCLLLHIGKCRASE